ncbi:hypothetical protein V6N12_004341 [Hibiscus sabdariffa]|uniref:Uncharacterized protein n=1 Tax=Hibiscus sabdariffa TaxID=183260 RepID=A0ABR2CMX0_9ROSI
MAYSIGDRMLPNAVSFVNTFSFFFLFVAISAVSATNIDSQESGKVGFSRKCPVETAVRTMSKGMDVAILLSQLGSPKFDEL